MKKLLFISILISPLVFLSLPTPTNACTRNLSLGSEGSGVHCLQQMLTLTKDYTYGEITGYFGPVTQAAIQKFQARMNIVNSGTPATTGYGNAGPITRLTLLQEALKILQTQLALLTGQPITPPATTGDDSGGVDTSGEGNSEGGSGSGEGTGGSTVTAGEFLERKGTKLYLDGEPLRVIGLNKHNIFNNFLGYPYAGQTKTADARDQAIKAMKDAKKHGFSYFRVTITPFYPLPLQKEWLDNPDSYWAAMDDMLAEAEKYDQKIIPDIFHNIWAFTDISNEHFPDLFVEGSDSRTLLFKYIDELVTRYKDNDTILFWDLINEMNLEADRDFASHDYYKKFRVAPALGTPSVRTSADNYSSKQVRQLIIDMATFIKERDQNHLVSAGYSRPLPDAWYAHNSSGFDGPATVKDSLSDMEKYVAYMNPDPIDIVSMHWYPQFDRYGLSRNDLDVLEHYVDAANAIGKPMFFGEFGDIEPNVYDNPTANRTREFSLRLATLNVPLSLFWAWETYITEGELGWGGIDPNKSSNLVEVMKEGNKNLAAAPKTISDFLAVPNGEFETNTGVVWQLDDWTGKTDGSSTDWSVIRIENADQAFLGEGYARLKNSTTDPASFVYLENEDVISVSGRESVTVYSAIRRASQVTRLTVVEYDSNGNELRKSTKELTANQGWRFAIISNTVNLLPNTASIKVQIATGGTAGAIIDVDHVRVIAR